MDEIPQMKQICTTDLADVRRADHDATAARRVALQCRPTPRRPPDIANLLKVEPP